MADCGNSDRDIEQALIALKKGTQLIKYCTEGKPKFRTFRLSTVHGVGNNFQYSCSSEENLKGKISKDSSSIDNYLNSSSSHVGSEYTSMQMRTSNADGFRISISSTPSCSSQGSGTDDIESLGDIYVWGEIWYDEIIDGTVNPNPIKNDVLTPKVVESNVVLDVQQIACGVQHIALVTRQGEVFTWGEESGGRLGHGVEKDFSRPRLVEFLALTNIEFVACGEFHTSALSASGDLYTWGDGTHNVGLLGHGKNGSHWIPKRVSGSLESLHVTSVACGTWHSAVVTSTGNLFTFGDGTFGALGHGDHESVAYPKEVQSLRGLKTVSVSCGAWHTAAIVEVTSHPGVNASSRKLFTWGDGDKNRLGHGNKETYLVPTCVSAIIDYNIQQLACGHNITVALTTSGHVFTMGSTEHGQLGDPQSDGKRPRLVQDALVGQFVEQISCGTHHVAVLTGRNEVFMWGKGANGRLGHGDLEDRNVPTMVEALKDKHVKSIVCGSNYTASICIHKWVAGPDQSFCTACKQAFGFTRKRHNCYNCGLVHCHACLCKKSLRAALAPTPGKPHRVCDSCYLKLKKGADIGNRTSLSQRASGTSQRIDRGVGNTSQVLLSNRVDPVKYLDIKSAMHGTSASQVPSRLQLRDVSFPSSFSVLQRALKPVITSAPYPQQASPQPQPYSRPVSPQSQANSAMSMAAIDSLQVANEILTQQVSKLHNQVKSLKQKNESQDKEIQKLKKAAQETTSLAAAGSSKCFQAVQAVKTISQKLKEIREKIPPEIYESESFKIVQAQVESLLHISGALASEGSSLRPPEPTRELNTKEHLIVPRNIDEASIENNGSSVRVNQSRVEGGPGMPETASAKAQREVIEQFEPGVYVTLLQLPNGNKFFKRIRFSKRRFSEQQAEEWWTENKERLLRKYNPTRTSNMPGDGTPPESPAEVFHEAAQSFADLNVVQE